MDKNRQVYKRTPWTEEEKARLAELVHDGYSWDEITRKLRRNISACHSKAEQMGLKKKAALGNTKLPADKMPRLADAPLEHANGRMVNYG